MVRRIVVFGSWAVGDEEERSDIDLAISTPDLDRAAVATLRDAVASTRTLFKISVTRIEDRPTSLRPRVLAQGRTIFVRERRCLHYPCLMIVVRRVDMSCRAAKPFSRPWPDFFMPPKGSSIPPPAPKALT